MADFQVRCVRVFGAPETKKLLEDAFKCLKDEGLSPIWFTEDECFSVKVKEKHIVYLFDVFEGEAFEHIASLQCRILGPMCILTSLACKKNIPKRSAPVYNLAMKDVVVCCTNLDAENRNQLHLKVERMGGESSKNFTEDVTHLVAGSVGSKKYLVAASCGKQIMKPSWVDAVWGKAKLNAVHGLDEEFQEHKCPIFLGRNITVSGLGSKERKEAQRLIEKEGGTYSGEMKVKECTHLIINEPKGQKYSFALKWQIFIVRSEWLYDSIEKGFCQDEAEYALTAPQEGQRGNMKTSTPERTSIAGGMNDISNISMISMVNINETVASNITNMTNMTVNSTHMLEPDPTEGLDLQKQPHDLFLDGIKVYLSGFRGATLERLRKIINSGGGTRFNKISENLTHVVIGERIPSDMEQMKALNSRPSVVTSQWLVECYRQESTVDESPFTHPDFTAPDPSTPKRPTRKSVAKKEAPRPSTSHHTEAAPIDEAGEDVEDIMSQYMAGAQHDTDAEVTKSNNDITVAPPEPLDDDCTQELNNTTAMEPGQGIFGGKTFVFYGFEDEHIPDLTNFIKENGGQVLKQRGRHIPDFAIVPVDGFPVERTVKDIVTNTWLQMCIEQDCLLDVHSNPLFTPREIQVDKNPLKDCVLSISGYAGTERDCLMHIAEVLGAKTQDYFVRRAKGGLIPSSHLIVNAPEGSKYEAAKKWNIPALSKLWILDCAKSGKREPEEKYLIDNEFVEEPTESRIESAEENQAASNTTTTSRVHNNSAQKQNTSVSVNREQMQSREKDQCDNDTSSDQDQNGAKNNSDHDVSELHEAAVGVNNMEGSVRRSRSGHGATNNQDFSATGDTEALLAELNTQGEVEDQDKTAEPDEAGVDNDVEEIELQDKTREPTVVDVDDIAATEVQDETREPTVVEYDNHEEVVEHPVHPVQQSKKEEPKTSNQQTRATVPGRLSRGIQKEAKKTETPPLSRFLKRVEQRREEFGSPAVTALSVQDKLRGMPPVRHNWQEEDRKRCSEEHSTVATETHPSQKENMAASGTPVQNRIKDLRKQDGKVTDKDTPSKFLNPNVRYHPRFDTEELMKAFDTPENVRAAKSKRRESLPLDELYDKMVEKASRTVLVAKEKKLETQSSTVLAGVVTTVAKKLGKDQTELNEIVQSLGGDYRWNTDSSCTHFIFQGRQNDTAKDFKLAKSQGLLIVSPHWLQMCKEQNARVDESLFPHTFNPNLQLSLSTKRTPLRTPRSTRRNVRDRMNSQQSEPAQTPVTHKATESNKKDDDTQSSKGSNSKVTVMNLRSPNRNTSDEDKEPKAAGKTDADSETGGSLEMREVLSRQLENVMAEAKGKRRRRSKRLNCSGQVGTPEEVSNSGSKRRTQEQYRNSSPSMSSKNIPDDKPEEKNTADLAPSQSVHVVWDDPMGRMEQEKLAHKLQRVESPTQDVSEMYGEPEDAQYSETDEEAEPPVPVFTDKAPVEDKTTPKAVRPNPEKTPTPEGPSIAFPTASKVQEVTPPKPIVIDDESQEKQKDQPIFIFTGMSQAEKDEYGALVEQLGGTVLDSQEFDSRCTHLVISTITRNEKFLASIATGNWVLHKSYFDACRKEKCFVDEDIYEWGSEYTMDLVKNLDTNVRQLASVARAWRIQLSEAKKQSGVKVGAFSEWKVLLCCEAKREQNFKRLLEAGGATVAIVRPPFNITTDVTHAFVDLQKVALSMSDIEELLKCGCHCLRQEYILAFLTDPRTTTEKYCFPEIKMAKAALEENQSSNKNLKRKASTSELSLKRSKKR